MRTVHGMRSRGQKPDNRAILPNESRRSGRESKGIRGGLTVSKKTWEATAEEQPLA